MSAPASVEELLNLIRKSGMIEEQSLNSYLLRRQSGRGLPSDPREVADSMIADGLITNFQAEQFLLGKWRGFTIGKYKLLERVGVGGMGQVFLCEHMYMKRRVAIKILPPAKAEQPAALGRFYREARAAGSLEHPNIVRTHDIDQDGNLHFIVMEYVDGSNLLDIVKKNGPMDIGRACYYIQQVARGLEFAFHNGIIHRDIKPGNILIDRRGQAKILDMGLARFYKDQTDMLTIKYDDKIVLGTADYVAPEQVANSHNVDVRADIYALGASLYFLLAGHPAFPSGTVSQKLLWHRTKDPMPIRQIRPEVPELLASVLTKMLMKDPAKRYQTPAEVAQALAPFVPSDVDLPSEQEMPKLSLASQDSGQADVASVPLSKLRASMEEQTPVPLSHPKSVLAAAAVSVGRGSFTSQPAPSSNLRSGPKTTNIPRNTLQTPSIATASPFQPILPSVQAQVQPEPFFPLNPFANPVSETAIDPSLGVHSEPSLAINRKQTKVKARVVPNSASNQRLADELKYLRENPKLFVFSMIVLLSALVAFTILALKIAKHV